MRGVRISILEDINDERIRQDFQWGGQKHDDTHTVGQWRELRGKYEKRAIVAHKSDKYLREREDLLKIAALAVAQIESLDRQFGDEIGEQALTEFEGEAG